MANRRQLVKRRTTVRNIRKITRTMQLIATARFQKAMTRALATRPYAEKLTDMVTAVARSSSAISHPLLGTNDSPRIAMLVITSNRGLCGGYNANVLRTAMQAIRAHRQAGQSVDVHALGKKGANYFRFLGETVASTDTLVADNPRFELAAGLADRLMDAFTNAEIGAVEVAYMQFLSAGTQRPTILRLLPLASPATDAGAGGAPRSEIQIDYSPAPEVLLGELLPSTVRMRLFQCLTEAAASEQVARMVAMKAATDAAGDMIKLLTRQYNRARQTSITMELLDIIGGVAAIE